VDDVLIAGLAARRHGSRRGRSSPALGLGAGDRKLVVLGCRVVGITWRQPGHEPQDSPATSPDAWGIPFKPP
jgi:hypothetical protein